jgi:hypothetical protein
LRALQNEQSWGQILSDRWLDVVVQVSSARVYLKQQKAREKMGPYFQLGQNQICHQRTWSSMALTSGPTTSPIVTPGARVECRGRFDPSCTRYLGVEPMEEDTQGTCGVGQGGLLVAVTTASRTRWASSWTLSKWPWLPMQPSNPDVKLPLRW